jgi:hypothetical protein
MFERAHYSYMGVDYVLARAWSASAPRMPGDERLEPVSHFEARCVLQEIARRDARLFGELYAAVTLRPSAGPGVFREPHPFHGVDRQLTELIQALGREPVTHVSERPTFARLYVLRWAEPGRARVAAQETSENRQLDGLITQLGRGDLIHRGNSYRVTRTGAMAEVKDRVRYETLSERESLSLMKEMSEDPHRSAPHKAALTQLLTLAAAQHGKGRSAELLLLRRVRSHTTRDEEEPAVTPSQLRKAQSSHYIEVEAVDEHERPVRGVRLDVVLVSGGTTTLSTNEDGIARLENMQAGTVTIRVLELDGSMWKPASGDAATMVDRAPKRVHVVATGENLSRIAKRYGIKGWKKLWDAPENEKLRNKRENPHIIQPGDEVTVPGKEVQGIRRDTDQTHRIVVAVHRPVVGVINMQFLSDVSEVCTDWHDGSSTLAATTSMFQDDASAALRMNDVPEGSLLALSLPPAGGASDGGAGTSAPSNMA